MTDPMTNPVGYDPASRTHTVYSEDFALLDGQLFKDYPYTVNAYLTNYPVTQSSLPDASALIEFRDPCPIPEQVTAVA